SLRKRSLGPDRGGPGQRRQAPAVHGPVFFLRRSLRRCGGKPRRRKGAETPGNLNLPAMNDILRTIIDHKRTALEKARREISTAELESSPAFGRPTRSLRESLLRPGSTGIIAEFKRRSPSKGM